MWLPDQANRKTWGDTDKDAVREVCRDFSFFFQIALHIIIFGLNESTAEGRQ